MWPYHVGEGFSGGSDGKETACNVGDWGSVPGLGRSPGEGNGYPLHSGRLQSMGSQRVSYDWATKHTHMLSAMLRED